MNKEPKKCKAEFSLSEGAISWIEKEVEQAIYKFDEEINAEQTEKGDRFETAILAKVIVDADGDVIGSWE